MKKIIIVAAAFSFLGLAACKKEYTCTCTQTNTDNRGVVTTDAPNVTTFKKIKKGDALDNCVSGSHESTTTSGSSTYTNKTETNCELK